MRSSSRAVSAALVATLLLAACGSDGASTGAGDGAPTDSAIDATLPDVTIETMPDSTTPDTTADTTAETTPDASTATTEPEAAAQDVDGDTAGAEAALIAAAALPEGWTESPRETEAASALNTRLAECVGVDGDGIAAADAAAASGRFVSPDGNLAISQDIGVRVDEREARSVVALIVEPAVPSCFEAAYTELAGEALGATVAEGASFGAPTVTRLQVGSVGDATQAIRVVVPVTGDPSVTAVTIDHVVVRSGRALASLTFENRTEATAVETIDEFTALAAAGLSA